MPDGIETALDRGRNEPYDPAAIRARHSARHDRAERRMDSARTIGAEDTTALLRRALLGESFALDREAYTLHDLTQIALALHPDASLAISRADLMTPIEKASIASVGQGRVVFV